VIAGESLHARVLNYYPREERSTERRFVGRSGRNRSERRTAGLNGSGRSLAEAICLLRPDLVNKQPAAFGDADGDSCFLHVDRIK
jgi:hypothetical protein